MRTAKANVGERFGRLTVISLSHKDKSRSWHVWVKCSCGTEKTVKFSTLSSGGIRSCGCLRDEQARVNAISSSTTHGMTRTPTYATWSAMLARCANPGANSYGTYNGVSVCTRWLKFENFLADMGRRPDGMSLDRFPDRKGGYNPENCRWATPKEQALNRKTTRWIEWEGCVYSIEELATYAGMKAGTLYMRLKRGWAIERAVTIPDDGSSRRKQKKKVSESLADNLIVL